MSEMKFENYNVTLDGQPLLLTGVRVSYGNPDPLAEQTKNTVEMVKRWNMHDSLTEEVERLTAQNKALIAAISEAQDLPMHRIDEASFILNQALEVQNAKS